MLFPVNLIAMNRKTISAVMREMGRKGGKAAAGKGGKRSLETMTPEERTVRAKKAAAASAKVRAKTKTYDSNRVS